MAQTSFDVTSVSQYVKLTQLENVKGDFDGIRSHMHIFLMFELTKPQSVTCFTVTHIQAKLKLSNPNILLSETQETPCILVELNRHERGVWFSFVLDDKAIHAIEKNRRGDIVFCVELQTMVALISPSQYPNGGFVSCVTKPLEIMVPRSEWVERIFPRLGYHNFKLIEIPFTHEKLREAYADIISEFRLAEEYFNKPDYDKCVAHCRSTMDALTRNLGKIKKLEQSETAFEWLRKIDAATFAWIDALNKSNQSLTSKPHHAGMKENFSRAQAESIYMVTLGLLSYVGHVAE